MQPNINPMLGAPTPSPAPMPPGPPMDAQMAGAVPPEAGPPPSTPFNSNTFSAPIPGESLTGEPGNAPFERPPQFAKLEDALNFVFSQLLKPAIMKPLLVMLKHDIPVEALVRTILFSGFADGKWSPDLALLMAKPVTYMVAAIGAKAGMHSGKLSMKDRSSSKAARMALFSLSPLKEDMKNSDDMVAPVDAKSTKDIKDTFNKAAKKTGLMTRTKV